MSEIETWLHERAITEVECLVSDQSGIARGKILPAAKFTRSLADNSLRIPEELFVQTVTGDYPHDQENRVTDPAMRDVRMRPDPNSLRIVPWYEEPTAQVIGDCYHHDGSVVDIAPRQVLRRVLDAYAERNWRPVVAPELEFFLTKVNEDPDYPLEPPIGQSKRPESGSQSYGIEAVNEFDPVFDDVYDWCEAQELDVDTLTHEGGVAQMEMNFNHGDPLLLADQAFPVQAYRAQSRAQARHVCDLHGQADGKSAGQRHAYPSKRRQCRDRCQYFRQTKRRRYQIVHEPYRRPAEIPAGGDAAFCCRM